MSWRTEDFLTAISTGDYYYLAIKIGYLLRRPLWPYQWQVLVNERNEAAHVSVAGTRNVGVLLYFPRLCLVLIYSPVVFIS